MRSFEIILAFALLVAPLAVCAAADGEDNNAYVLNPEAREELIAFVNEA